MENSFLAVLPSSRSPYEVESSQIPKSLLSQIDLALKAILSTASNSVAEMAKMGAQNTSDGASLEDVRNTYEGSEKSIQGVVDMASMTLVIGERPMTIMQDSAAVEILKATTDQIGDRELHL